MERLSAAIALAVRAHDGQVDKAGAPYILHPLRVMLRFDDESDRIVAVLHDVLEDNDSLAILSELHALVTDDEYNALNALTHLPGETYAEFIERVKANAQARRIKYEDVSDNYNRLNLIADAVKRASLGNRYSRALHTLRMVV